MKLYKNILSIIAGLFLIYGLMSCEKLEFGNDFLSAPPTIDYTVDSVFSSTRQAQEMLTAMYATLPYGFRTRANNNRARHDGHLNRGWETVDGLTDITSNHTHYDLVEFYYDNTLESAGANSIFGWFENNRHWSAHFMGWTLINNLHKVPDIGQAEMDLMKAEARMIMATHYVQAFKHWGGIAWVGKAYTAEDDLKLERLTVMATVDSITALIDKAIPYLPTEVANIAADKGRFDKAGAYALKARFLLHAASPLFNSDQPYMQGEASDKQLVWTGGYKPELWEMARDAAKACIDIIEASAHYGMEQPASQDSAAYRLAFRKGYLDRGSGEALISTRMSYKEGDFWYQAFARAGHFPWTSGPAPTHTYALMFPDKNGVPLSKSSLYNPDDPYRNRDPRFYETLFSSISQWNQNRKMELWKGGQDGWDKKSGAKYGYMWYKFVLSNFEIRQYTLHWPMIRVPEIYLSYAEALTEINNGPTAEAYEYVNKVRRRVGLGDIQDAMNNPGDKQEFIDALLTERALEFGAENHRWWDVSRRKRKDILQKDLYGVNVIKNPDGSLSYEEFIIWDRTPESKRLWIDDWSPKWYLFPLGSGGEILKDYGLVQNPGWEYFTE
jgi:starch-binding outer membrane protein, SusD/RagB family